MNQTDWATGKDLRQCKKITDKWRAWLWTEKLKYCVVSDISHVTWRDAVQRLFNLPSAVYLFSHSLLPQYAPLGYVVLSELSCLIENPRDAPGKLHYKNAT